MGPSDSDKSAGTPAAARSDATSLASTRTSYEVARSTRRPEITTSRSRRMSASQCWTCRW